MDRSAVLALAVFTLLALTIPAFSQETISYSLGSQAGSVSGLSQDDENLLSGEEFAETLADRPQFFKLTEFNIYPTFSFLADRSATYNEFEFASRTNFGFLEMENRTVLNVADLPSVIKLGPTNPNLGPPGSAEVRENGFGDILSGFFFPHPDLISVRRMSGSARSSPSPQHLKSHWAANNIPPDPECTSAPNLAS